MDLCGSSDPVTKEIDTFLQESGREEKKTVKLLLLGAGESGTRKNMRLTFRKIDNL
jgi:hypothetical protein